LKTNIGPVRDACAGAIYGCGILSPDEAERVRRIRTEFVDRAAREPKLDLKITLETLDLALSATP
jgi:hypothetical protein